MVTVFQTYIYYSRFPRDDWMIKTTVAVLCALDTALTALASQILYFYLVTLFPFPETLVDITRTLCTEIGVSFITIFIVQLFYGVVVWWQAKNRLISVLIALVTTAAFGVSLAVTVLLFRNATFAYLSVTSTKTLMSTAQALRFLAAFVTSASLVFQVTPPFKPTISEILASYILTRGTAASAIQCGYFLVFLCMPSDFFWLPFHLVATKVFVNSLLTALNSRVSVRGRGLDQEDTVAKSSRSQRSGPGSPVVSKPTYRFQSMGGNAPIAITVSSTVERDADQYKVTYDEDKSSLSSQDLLAKKAAELE